MSDKIPLNSSCLFALLSLALIAFLTAKIITPVTTQYNGQDSDGRYYYALAEKFKGNDSKMAHIAPWNSRILTPLVVSLLPGDTFENFSIVSRVCAFINLLLLYFLLLKLGLSSCISLLGVVLYAFSFWSLRAPNYSPCYIDAVTQTLSIISLLLLLAHKFLALSIVMFFCGLQKESLLLLSVPALFYLREKKYSVKFSAPYFCGILAIGIFGVVAGKYLSPAYNIYKVEAQIKFVFLEQILFPQVWPRIFAEILVALGAILVPLLAFPRQIFGILKTNSWIAIFLVLGLIPLFSGVDKGRLLLPIMPILIYLSLKPVGPKLVFKTYFWLIPLQAVFGGYFMPLGDFENYLTHFAVVHTQTFPTQWFILLLFLLMSGVVVLRWQLCNQLTLDKNNLDLKN